MENEGKTQKNERGGRGRVVKEENTLVRMCRSIVRHKIVGAIALLDIFSYFYLIILQIRKLSPECYDRSNILLYPASVYPGVYLALSPKLLLKCEVTVTQLCLTLCHTVDCSWLGSSVYGILQARILEWQPFPSPGDLPDSGIKLESPSLKTDSLPSEPPGVQSICCEG